MKPEQRETTLKSKEIAYLKTCIETTLCTLKISINIVQREEMIKEIEKLKKKLNKTTKEIKPIYFKIIK